MPTYDYECAGCGHTFEEFQSMMDKPLKKCPQCKKSRLRRLLGTGAAIIFKGSGFYQTDYRSDSYKSAAKAEESSRTDASKADTAKAANSSAPSAKGTAKTSDTAATAGAAPDAKAKPPDKKPKSSS